MKKTELVQKLKEIENKSLDQEKNHEAADNLLLQYINDDEVTKAFNQIEKWYA